MARTRRASNPDERPEEPADDDVAGEADAPDDPEKRLSQTERLLGMHKYRHTQGLAIGDPETAVGELAQIAKLEREVMNQRAFLRVRAITSDRPTQ